MNNQIAICTTCFGGEAYLSQQGRLLNSLKETNPGKTLFIHSNNYPPGSLTFENSLYGFKVHAVKEAIRQGYTKIIWLDTACIVHGELDYLFDDDMPPVVAVKDDTPLYRTISDKAMKYYGWPDTTGWHLVGGSLYAFDFDKPGCQIIFDHWAKAEGDGIFGNMKQMISEQINKHRNDESCMSIAMYTNGVLPVTNEVGRYCTGDNSVILKKHFK